MYIECASILLVLSPLGCGARERVRVIEYASVRVDRADNVYCSVSLRNWARSTMLVMTNPCRLANRFISGSRIISVGFSSETISQRIPTGFRPANRARSTAASVCPSRVNTPPSFARSGNRCPGRLKSAAVVVGSANNCTVLARSEALMPVVMPCSLVASTVTLNAVPLGSSLF